MGNVIRRPEPVPTLQHETTELKRFDLSSIKAPVVCCFTGLRACGKSTALRTVLDHIKPDFTCHVADQGCEDFMHTMRKQAGSTAAICVEDFYLPLSKCDGLHAAICNGRHYGTSVLLTEQYPSLDPAVRANVDYHFLFPHTASQVERIYRMYGDGVFANLDQFRDALAQATRKKGHCLVLGVGDAWCWDALGKY